MANPTSSPLFSDKGTSRYDADIPYDDLDESPPKRFTWLKILIAMLLLGIAAYAFYHYSKHNARRYTLVQQNRQILVKKGRFFPTGDTVIESYPPIKVPPLLQVPELTSFQRKECNSLDDVEYQLFGIYRQLALGYLNGKYDKSIPRLKALTSGRIALADAARLKRLSERNQERLGRLLFRFYLAEARFHLLRSRQQPSTAWATIMGQAKHALYEALRLRHISDAQREAVDNLLGDVYYLEGKIILSGVAHNLKLAKTKFNKARRKDAVIYTDAEQWITFIDKRLSTFSGLDDPFAKPAPLPRILKSPGPPNRSAPPKLETVPHPRVEPPTTKTKSPATHRTIRPGDVPPPLPPDDSQKPEVPQPESDAVPPTPPAKLTRQVAPTPVSPKPKSGELAPKPKPKPPTPKLPRLKTPTGRTPLYRKPIKTRDEMPL